MDRILISVAAAFLSGAILGAWSCYARDRRMLAMYENLVEQLSKALRRGAQFRASACYISAYQSHLQTPSCARTAAAHDQQNLSRRLAF